MSFPDTVKMVLALGVLVVALPLHGQAPSTDIVILSMSEAAGEFHLQSPVRVTDRAGYDNQPHFLPGGEALLYTSIDGTGQADIYRYSISTGERTRVTTSAPESEYSPTLIPGERRFSAIRVEADSAQRLWSFALDGSGAQVLLPEIAPVGYHAWGENEVLALFVLGQPATLRLARPGPGGGEIKASNIGRSLHRIPGRNAFSFVQIDGEGTGSVMELDMDSGDIRFLVRSLPENEFNAWTPAGTLLSAAGSLLYRWVEGDADWVEVADLSDFATGTVSRLAVSPEGDRLALVVSRD